MNAKTIVHALFHQLTNGCNKYNCDNKECRSCKDFMYSFANPNEAAKTAITLAKDYTNHICKGLPPAFAHPEYIEVSKKFAEILKTLIAKKNLDEVKAELTTLLNTIFSSVEQFEYLFLVNDQMITRKNLSINDDLIQDVSELFYQYSDFFITFTSQFTNLINQIVSSYDYSAHYLRAFLVIGAFRFYFDDENGIVSEIYVKLMDKMQKSLPKDARLDLFDQFGASPHLAYNYLQMCHYNLTLMALLHEGPVTFTESQSIYGTTTDFLIRLRDSSDSPNSILKTRDFYNDPFSEKIINDIKETHRFNLNSIEPSRAVINIETKSEILRAVLSTDQEMASRDSLFESFLRGRVNENDIQLVISVRRSNLIEDSIRELSKVSQKQLQRRLTVKFENEPGVDAGGVSREFFYLITAELFNPDHGMFTLIDNSFYWFNISSIEQTYLFNLLGTIIGLAIYNGVILPIKFPCVMYKKLQELATSVEDLKEIMPQEYQSLMRLKELVAAGEDIEDCCLTFSVTYNKFDAQVTEDLITDGRNIPVTSENFDNYVKLYVDWYLNKSVDKMFDAFKKGFDKLCHRPEFKIFTPDELQVLVSGEDVFDWDALRLGTKYIEGYKETSTSVKMFWEIFNELPEEKKVKFLLFSTGTDKAPVGGLAQTHLVIQRSADDTKLPVSHTCFNIFALPDYKDKEKMKKNLLIALEHTEGFGLK